ncbi:universal stress protein [Haloglomus salinum]|jgi:nucleotide-binding universal stress UspA family protein|uniref:universal stress protein n=1 Tax=Haloglomus salinum TaxID=2962673 RepID=UPI0020CA0A8A|nr:universal stress protein [Haloglomus salinum]
MTGGLLRRVVVPVADPDDARATARALRDAPLPDDASVLVVFVVEKAGGAPDKASVEQREAYGRGLFETFETAFGSDTATVESELRYGTDIAETIVTAAHETDASAIAFTPRGGSRWVKLLTGDVATSLVEGSDIPVVVLPDVDEAATDGGPAPGGTDE